MHDIREIYDPSCTDELYAQAGIRRPTCCETSLGVFAGEKPVAAASIRGNILMGFAIAPHMQGEGLAGVLCARLIHAGMEAGHSAFYIFTKPEKAFLFEACGFREIVNAPGYASLLEYGSPTIDDFTQKLRELAHDKPKNAAAIIMNANPFTLGHRYLAERASAENDWVYILVVEEDQSVFPYDVRLELVRRGTSHLANVTVIGGGSYVISALTFPSYFTKDGEAAAVQSEVDLRLFGRYIAPALGVKKRYVGMEPYCGATRQYNLNMHRILPLYDIELKEIDRLENEGGFISATKVREAIGRDDLPVLKEALPDTTLDFLTQTQRGGQLLQAVKQAPDAGQTASDVEQTAQAEVR